MTQTRSVIILAINAWDLLSNVDYYHSSGVQNVYYFATSSCSIAIRSPISAQFSSFPQN